MIFLNFCVLLLVLLTNIYIRMKDHKTELEDAKAYIELQKEEIARQVKRRKKSRITFVILCFMLIGLGCLIGLMF